MAELKNNYYKQLIKELTPNDILPGAMDNLEKILKKQNNTYKR